jgi:diadenosine tetraphosphate (Ap4A) HIT family hydrolase
MFPSEAQETTDKVYCDCKPKYGAKYNRKNGHCEDISESVCSLAGKELLMEQCRFCELVRTGRGVVDSSVPGFVIVEEPVPVSKGHVLIISREHMATMFDLSPSEGAYLIAAIQAARAHIAYLHTPDGYNIGTNCGEAAGQSQMHFHMHVIPRHIGDHPNPRGGIRNILPNAPPPLA